MTSPNDSVSKMITHPVTNKRMKRVFVTGKGWFSWNTAYHVYNSTENYAQLKVRDIANIDFDQVAK